MVKTLTAPFPWFGGKSRAADLIWARFGDTVNYVEPFAGSLAVLLARPHEPRNETVNDLDAYIANFWRALQVDPAGVAKHADWPVNETDLHARHAWLMNEGRSIADRCLADPEFFDVRVAGWWVWGICLWIGAGWCAGSEGSRKRPRIARGGRGVASHKIPYIDRGGKGVHRADVVDVEGFLVQIAQRLRRVRVVAGDFRRVLTPAATTQIGTTAVLLDPPYLADTGRDMRLYTTDDGQVAHAAREWALKHGSDPRLRIALCGFEGEHEMPDTWECVGWKPMGGGYSRQARERGEEGRDRERIWFSPHCLRTQLGLFDTAAGSLA